MNEIVGFINETAYSLKKLQQINTPKDLCKVIPFMKKELHSDWIEMPYNEEDDYTECIPNVDDIYIPRHFKIEQVDFSISTTRNEVNEKYYRIYGHLPKYVLDGIGWLIDQEYESKL